jgi:hypothetical protein
MAGDTPADPRDEGGRTRMAGDTPADPRFEGGRTRRADAEGGRGGRTRRANATYNVSTLCIHPLHPPFASALP